FCLEQSKIPQLNIFESFSRRERFPRLADLGSSLGSAEIADVGSCFKWSRPIIHEAERRVARAAVDANVPPARLYLRSTSRGVRRAVDIFMPRFQPDEDWEEQLPEDRSESSGGSLGTPPLPSNGAVRRDDAPSAIPTEPFPVSPTTSADCSALSIWEKTAMKTRKQRP
ncbi:uncharacterized protein LOC108093383, partial [Drosophila ficusphila]|uniref:uncharacterized protein LOC108093383 n=1 Tax=Drosophila ficusphila TaxID=30025 RepID=UPI0007E730DC